MASRKTSFNIRQNDAFTFSTRSKNKDTGESYDYSTDTGTAHLMQGDVTVLEVPLDLTFVDINSDNMSFVLNTAQTLALDEGEYELVMRVEQPAQVLYFPQVNRGHIYINILPEL